MTDAGEKLRERVRAQFREHYPDYTIAELTTIEGIVRTELERAAQLAAKSSTSMEAAFAIRKLKE